MSAGGIRLLALGLAFFVSLSACARVMVLKDPLTPEEHINLAVAYESKGEWDAALRHYEVASKELPIAYLYMGNAYFLKKNPKKAEKYYNKALRKNPENADAMNNLAWLYYTEGKNLDRAEDLAMEALRTNPDKSEIYNDTLLKIRSLKKSEASPLSAK